MGELPDFQRGQIVGARLAGESVNKTATLWGVSRAADPKVVTAYTNCGKTLSAKRKKSGQKPKPSGRDSRILNTIVSKNHTATLWGVSRAADPKVVTAYTNRGKTLSAKRKSGQKPKVSGRDSRILNTIVSKNHTATLWVMSRAAVLKVMTAYTNRGNTSSAKRKSKHKHTKHTPL